MQDHPRGCGEKVRTWILCLRQKGSSPRVRGKDVSIWPIFPKNGIIPAGAGKSRALAQARLQLMDHPRGCGEKRAMAMAGKGTLGSSPRVRGKAHLASSARRGMGIIPAGAGKRLWKKYHPRDRRDHPRGCGEKPTVSISNPSGIGSSPRVRGKDTLGQLQILKDGIIPAGAGKSLAGPRVGSCARDHPRGCGEKFIFCQFDHKRRGSSPRVRGKERPGPSSGAR